MTYYCTVPSVYLSDPFQKLQQTCAPLKSSKQWVRAASLLVGRDRHSMSWAVVIARLCMDTG